MVSIHATDPFATPDDARSSLRRLRGRLPAGITLWTAYGERPAGLTVSSMLVADGEPGHVLGLLDEESDLFAVATSSGRFLVCLLRSSDRRIADIFAGIIPVPGGPFQSGWTETPYGPLLSAGHTWAGCRVDEVRPLGYGQLVTATIEAVQLGDEDPPLIHYRGRYADGPYGGPGLDG